MEKGPVASRVVVEALVGPVRVGRLDVRRHSVDRRLHDVIGRDVVVPGKWQTRRFHGDPVDHQICLDDPDSCRMRYSLERVGGGGNHGILLVPGYTGRAWTLDLGAFKPFKQIASVAFKKKKDNTIKNQRLTFYLAETNSD
ncbi:hypothetical protein EVAR_11672_1 [Eumeta japonica]|uniref:Uncharacterized protein n=1 Tax=Eumeta variegata TaxID=151549 RepID=A0A4C1U584_EUMVA|nr:hypothetical protein EVAR_11672_1 [Eumeta japonica]